MGAVLEQRISHVAREKKKEKTGPAVQSEAGSVVAETGASASSQLAKLYSKDAGLYQQTLEELKLTLGPAGVEVLHADVMTRINNLAAVDTPPEKKAAMEQALASIDGQSVRQEVLDRFSGPLEASPDQAEKLAEGAAEEAGQEPPGIPEVTEETRQEVAQTQGVDPKAVTGDQATELIQQVAPQIAADKGMTPEDGLAAAEELATQVADEIKKEAEAAGAGGGGGDAGGGESEGGDHEPPEAPPQLPADVGTPPDREPIDPDPEPMAAMASIGAEGVMSTSVAYLNPAALNPNTPDGQATFGAEVSTVATLESAMTGDGSEVSAPAEVSVRPGEVAGAYQAGQGAPVQKQEAAGGGDSGGGGGSAIKLNLAGQVITLNPPAGGGKQVKVPIPQSPVPGLQMPEADLTLNDNGDVESGSIKVLGAIGNFVTIPDGKLDVGAGGAVTPLLRAADLKIGGLTSGTTIDLEIGPNGVSGSATITHEQILLPLGLILMGGFIRVTLDATGAMSGVGNLTGLLPGIGTFAIEATLIDGVIGGTIALTLDAPMPVLDGVSVESAILAGNYVGVGFVLSGPAQVRIGDVAAGQGTASFEFPQRRWSVQGNFPMTRPITVGRAVVNNGTISVVIEGGALGEAAGGGELDLGGIKGQIGGAFDLGKGQFIDPVATVANPQALTPEAVAILDDSGEWGKNVIRAGGPRAMQMAGWGMADTSQEGEATAEEAAGGVQAVQGMFGL